MEQASAPDTPIDPIVGIDLGTTNSLVAFCGDAGPRVLGGGALGAMLPSVVRFLADGSTVVGQSARRQARQDERELGGAA
ncbi:MAG: Hsp70 family protein, partial [Vulcanococcus sp.]